MISGIGITVSSTTKPHNPTKNTGRQERVMRTMISGMVAAAAVLTVSAAPASACGGLGLFSSCSPCGVSYSSCGGGYGAGYGYGGYSTAYSAGVAGYGYGGGCGGGCGSYETLPVLSPQYY